MYTYAIMGCENRYFSRGFLTISTKFYPTCQQHLTQHVFVPIHIIKYIVVVYSIYDYTGDLSGALWRRGNKHPLHNNSDDKVLLSCVLCCTCKGPTKEAIKRIGAKGFLYKRKVWQYNIYNIIKTEKNIFV